MPARIYGARTRDRQPTRHQGRDMLLSVLHGVVQWTAELCFSEFLVRDICRLLAPPRSYNGKTTAKAALLSSWPPPSEFCYDTHRLIHDLLMGP